MTALSTTEVGEGPDIVLVHGVGAGPETFARLAALLAVDHHVVTVTRPQIDGTAVPLRDQAAALAETLVSRGGDGGVLLGVSGGATLALLTAIAHPGVLGGLVLHEPLVGEHVPGLHLQFAEAAARARRGLTETVDVIRSVLGPMTWAALDLRTRARMLAGATWAREEIPLFAAFAPTVADLTSLRHLPMLTTVGSRSGTVRWEAAHLLADLAGASIVEVPGSGNAVQLDAPGPFADAIRAWWPCAALGGA